MAKAVARVLDRCTGHGCFPSRLASQGSSDVFYNSKAAHRKGDSWFPHSCKGTHSGNLAQGSPTVFTNGKAQGRVQDPITCGGNVATGSPDIFLE